ncbi:MULTISPECIES: monovalent cation/H(+) antiporter subunit G [Marivita]|uniref:Monovalent cation/H(+) antiporter subunit G n=1 Tax=Marivita cryptomonadis TaxID=505252 RepID=A0A9Q2NNV7_9RHOB|nr:MULTISPECIES: monovalent cation/H(+) antiporter subunit G [Marivita]MCR9167012.1 monovalent cation/H(+) antiporter subunit G [Paracoccaceae bacterium]MBM2319890.1 monovalent cation/H(+) antiporter subunit G [Marivita cryptomonadis]MBM2329469.1 monovalent cation/H(+) antiporter subunit G [Marivita cryptomonadis]MBM2339057.1 monovalent cation/H(+) antiporter subunit G [Marivita cryptomonadis]MBM2343715.1 monovalent cation/H(+) antiporter subunit G [Marivita cryptomonadis]
MIEVVAGSLIILGGFFAVIGALGLLRLPDVLLRMHASTKIGTLACGLILLSSAVIFGTSDIIIRVIAIVLFILLTAPIGAHMMGRSVVSTGVPLWKNEGLEEGKLDTALHEEHSTPAGPKPDH